MKNLNFAIVGFGKMGQIRYNTLKEFGQCRVTWIMDKEKIEDLPQGVRFTHNIEDILADKNVDAIVICAANFILKDMTVRALDAGKHVFCEKPPGRNLAEVNEMIDAEKKNIKNKLMFGFNHRHHESMIKAKKLIDSGEYGTVLWMRGRYGKNVDEKFFSDWRAKRELSGGGIFLDQGIHMLDLFLMFVDDFEEVKAFVSNLYWKLDIEDNVFAMFRNKKGQVASLHSTMTQWRHLFSLEIFLERGYITINGLKTTSGLYGDEVLTIAKNRTAPPEASWTEEEEHIYHVDTSWKREMEIFIDCVTHNKPIPVGNSQDALKLMRLVEAVYKQG